MKTVLLTGFEPFEGRALNASEAIVKAIDGAVIGRHRVVGAVLPCVFGRASQVLIGHIKRHDPSIIICLGEASGRAAITPERVAINIDDARIPDNAGQQPVERAIARSGPAAYFSTLPIKAIAAALQDAGVPSSVSQTAGTFVCNHVFYRLMHELARHERAARGGFIHVPCLHDASGALPPMTLEQMTQAIRTAIAVSISRRDGARRVH